jgi:tyrosyl-tRNA synthetase
MYQSGTINHMPFDIQETLTRGVAEVLPSADTLADLMSKKKITLYLGIDPTGNQLHLGHAVVLRKLKQFADLGHHVILLIGNGTVKIGDPTGKDKTRPMLTEEQIDENFLTWKEQASKVLDFSKIEIKKNGDWLDKLTFVEMVKLMATTTVQQLMERDMFQERVKNGLPVYAHELIYPLAQGYDSVAMDVDLEIGGSDQIFNMMVGRQLMKSMRNKDKWVLGTKLLVGSDGRKMGKSLNNFIPLTDTPENMYGKLMSVVDEIMGEYFRLLTDTPLKEIDEIEAGLKSGSLHPMEMKKKLAHTITAQFHSAEAADKAAEYFERTVQKKEFAEEVSETLHVPAEMTAIDLVALTTVVQSKGEAKRLIEQGGVQLDGKKLIDPTGTLALKNGMMLKVGKRNTFTLQME